MDDDKIFQEWHCGTSGGGCDTFIRFRLNMNWDRVVNIICPMCKHQHQRFIKNGQIQDDGRFSNGSVVEDICPPKSACSKEPISKRFDKNRNATRDGEIIKSPKDLIRDSYMRELWLEFHGE